MTVFEAKPDQSLRVEKMNGNLNQRLSTWTWFERATEHSPAGADTGIPNQDELRREACGNQ